jgi:anti-sigma factor RsiW
MTPLNPAELSAYLDGELSETRAREVAAMIAANPALLDELDMLGREDAAWRVAAGAAAFRPALRLQAAGDTAVSSRTIMVCVALFVVIAAVVRGFDNLAVSLVLNLVAAALVSIGVYVLARSDLAMPRDAPLAM